MIHQKDHEKVE